MTVIIAYLAGLAVLVLLWRVFDGFVRKPVDRPLHRWVIVARSEPDARPGREPTEPSRRVRSAAESQSSR